MAALIKQQGKLGRTAMMKLLYFLQELRSVDLGYNFTLYTYGPFDSDVLEDLSYASALGVLRSQVVHYSGGYGYDIEPGDCAENIAADFEREHQEDVDWTLKHFGSRGAAGLELDSTLVFVDREAQEAGIGISDHDLVDRVKAIKPRFEKTEIEERLSFLRSLGVPEATP